VQDICAGLEGEKDKHQVYCKSEIEYTLIMKMTTLGKKAALDAIILQSI